MKLNNNKNYMIDMDNKASTFSSKFLFNARDVCMIHELFKKFLGKELCIIIAVFEQISNPIFLR